MDVIFFSRSLVQFLELTKHFSVSSTSAVEWIEPGFYSFLTVSFSLNFLFSSFLFFVYRDIYHLDMKSDLINAVQKTQNGHPHKKNILLFAIQVGSLKSFRADKSFKDF